MANDTYDPTDIRAREKQKADADARKEFVRKTEIADLKKLMSSPWGRRFMWRLLGDSGPFRPSFDQNAMKMAFNEGLRNMGTLLFNEVMNLCPELYPVMFREQQELQDGTKRDGNGNQSN